MDGERAICATSLCAHLLFPDPPDADNPSTGNQDGSELRSARAIRKDKQTAVKVDGRMIARGADKRYPCDSCPTAYGSASGLQVRVDFLSLVPLSNVSIVAL